MAQATRRNKDGIVSISVGDRIPDVTLRVVTEAGADPVTSSDLLGAGRVVLFAVPGAFTPTCSQVHLPSYVETAGELSAAGVDRIVCSPITVGQGRVQAAHGELPNPAPAVVDLLALRHAPTRGIADHRELATPTGVALMVALADEFGPMPAMRVHAVGYGAGTRDIPGRPNVVQVVIGESVESSPGPGQPVELLECNVDDATGEVVAHAIARLLAAGAHDAWASPIVMKKGRPAFTVHALCDGARIDAVRTVMVDETGTLGVRGSTMHRWPQQRTESAVVVDGHRIGVKLAAGRVKVEHDDAAAAAAALGLPLRVVMERAIALTIQP